MSYEQAEKFFGGSVTAFAKALKLPITTVHSWKTRGIPVGRQYELELLTYGKLKANRA